MKPIYAQQIAEHLQPGTRLSAFQYLELAGHTQHYLRKERAKRDEYLQRLYDRDTSELDERSKARHEAQIYHQQNRQNNDAALGRVVVEMADTIQRLERALNAAVATGRQLERDRRRAVLDAHTYQGVIVSMEQETALLTELLIDRLSPMTPGQAKAAMAKDIPYWERSLDVLNKNHENLTI